MRAFALALLLLIACTPASTPGTPTREPSSSLPATALPTTGSATPPASPIAAVGQIVEARSSVPRNGADAATNDQLATLVSADQAFAIDLYRTLIETGQGNV